MPHPNCKPGNPQPPPVHQVAHPNSQGWPPNQRHSYEPEQWPNPRMPYREVLPREPSESHPLPSRPPCLSGYPVDHATLCTPHLTQYYEEMYEEPPPNPSELDEYGFGDPAEGGPNDIGNSHSQHVNGPSSVVPRPHHSTGYLPNVNPCQSTGYVPDPNEPQSHNMPCNVPIPNSYHPRSAYGIHEVSSIHPPLPHPISQAGPDILSLMITHGSQSYHSHAQPVSLESPTAEANPHEAMAEEQPLAFQPTESPVVMANGPSCTPTLPCQDELAAGYDIPSVQEYSFHSQSLRDISPAQADASHINPGSLPYPSVDCIPACRDTPVPDGILQRQVLSRPKPKPWLSKKDVPPWPDVPKLQKDVPPWPNVPRPQPKPRLSLKRTSKVHDSPDTISHQDPAVPSTASGDVYCGFKCTPTFSDSNLGVSDEVETCIPSPVASPDLNDVTTCSSEVSEALSCVKSALSHAYAVLEHSLTHDIKLHPPDKSHLNSPPLSVTSASPKSPFDKVTPVQHGSSTRNLCPTLYTGKKEKYLNCSGDKALGDENTCQLMISPLISQGSIDQSCSHANH